MTTAQTCAFIALALWVGGMSFFTGVVLPRLFKTLPREEATKVSGILFLGADKWALGWGTITCAALFFVFAGRHFESRSLVIELPILLAWLLTIHNTTVQHPQIRQLQKKMHQPEFKGTTHLEKLKFAFNRMHLRSKQVQMVTQFLGWFSLGLAPGYLR